MCPSPLHLLSAVCLLAKFLPSSPRPSARSLGAAFPYFLLVQAPVSCNCTLLIFHPQSIAVPAQHPWGARWGGGGGGGHWLLRHWATGSETECTAHSLLCSCQPSVAGSDLATPENCKPSFLLVLSFMQRWDPTISHVQEHPFHCLLFCAHNFHQMLGSHQFC